MSVEGSVNLELENFKKCRCLVCLCLVFFVFFIAFVLISGTTKEGRD